MQLRIIGQSPKITRKELRYATKWIAGKLMSPQLIPHLKLSIILKPIKSMGLVEVVEPENYRPPREFKIYIDQKESRPNIIKTIGHELVHVKQYAKGELKEPYRGAAIKWKGRNFDTDQLEYWDQEWEIEAYGREYGLWKRYCDHLKKEKIKFND